MDSAGNITTFSATFSNSSGNIGLTRVSYYGTTGTNWGGTYTVSFAPAKQSKADVGLGNLDNTSDVNKPVSTAQQTALDLKADKSALGTAAAAATGDFATAAQGATADTAETHAQTGITNAATAQTQLTALQSAFDAYVAGHP